MGQLSDEVEACKTALAEASYNHLPAPCIQTARWTAGLACWLLPTRLSVLTEPAQGLFRIGPLHGYSRTAESVPKTSLASVNATAQP